MQDINFNNNNNKNNHNVHVYAFNIEQLKIIYCVFHGEIEGER